MFAPQNYGELPRDYIFFESICRWCRHDFETYEKRSAHQSSTTPICLQSDNYICEGKLPDHKIDLISGWNSDEIETSLTGKARGPDNYHRVAPTSYAAPTIVNTSPTRNLLNFNLTSKHEDTPGEDETFEGSTLDTLELGNDELDVNDLAFMQDPNDEEDGSENDELGDLIVHRNADAMTTLYGTSMPVGGSFGSFSSRAGSMSPLTSPRKQSFNFASPRTFGTAKSSLASYATAPSHPNPVGVQLNTRISLSAGPDTMRNHNTFANLVNDITAHLLHQLHPNVRLNLIAAQHEPKVRGLVQKALSSISPSDPNDWQGLKPNFYTRALIQRLLVKLDEFHTRDSPSDRLKIFDLSNQSECAALASYVESRVSHYFEARGWTNSTKTANTVFSSKWLAHLRKRGILLDPAEELDWSGKGQHVEYAPEEEQDIPLVSEKILGHSQNAIVESVRCRRIRLARKQITCSRQLKKEDAITEVEHLRQLQHAHVVRVVGTYTLKRHLAILLYPAADCDLDTFLNEQIDSPGLKRGGSADTTERFFGCLSNAMAFIHDHNVKHMDIKPKNILVRQRRPDFHTVYIADFGIARSYQSAGDSETDTPVSFTRTYAAPEVVLQDKRGFNADIFSLGCVFMEMMATIFSLRADAVCDERNRLLEIRKGNSGNPAFYASINRVLRWYGDSIRDQITLLDDPETGKPKFMNLCPRMLSEDPNSRPSSSELKDSTAWLSCHECDSGPELFEAAK